MGKDPEAGKDWGQEEKRATEDELIGWHHRLDGHEFEQTPGDGEGQRSLACCSPWGHRVGHDWSDLACTHVDLGAKISHAGGGGACSQGEPEASCRAFTQDGSLQLPRAKLGHPLQTGEEGCFPWQRRWAFKGSVPASLINFLSGIQDTPSFPDGALGLTEHRLWHGEFSLLCKSAACRMKFWVRFLEISVLQL